MSNYFRQTKNPATGEFETAEWLDGYFGLQVYGVGFQDGDIYDERTQSWEFYPEPPMMKWRSDHWISGNIRPDGSLEVEHHFVPEGEGRERLKKHENRTDEFSEPSSE